MNPKRPFLRNTFVFTTRATDVRNESYEMPRVRTPHAAFAKKRPSLRTLRIEIGSSFRMATGRCCGFISCCNRSPAALTNKTRLFSGQVSTVIRALASTASLGSALRRASCADCRASSMSTASAFSRPSPRVSGISPGRDCCPSINGASASSVQRGTDALPAWWCHSHCAPKSMMEHKKPADLSVAGLSLTLP